MDPERAEWVEKILAEVQRACSQAFDKSERDSAVRELTVAVYQLTECIGELLNDEQPWRNLPE